MTNVIELITGFADGGAETLVKDYALMLDRTKFDVTVLTLFPPEDSANTQRLNEGGIAIESVFPSRNLFYRMINRLCRKKFVSWRLKRIIKKKKADVLHVHMSLLKYVAPIADYIKESTRVLYTCHSFPRDFFGDEKHKSEYDAAKLLFEKCDFKMIAIAEAFVDELNEMFGVDSTVYLHNGVNFERFLNPEKSKTEVRSKLGIPEDAFVLGNIGRFVRYKNVGFLIDIFAEYKKKYDNAFLLLIGDGELKGEIQEKINSLSLSRSALILSHRKDIPELLRAMDVFVYPAFYEGLGIVMIEAQVSGLKCVVSDTMQKDVFITEQIFPVSPDAPVSEWCDAISGNAAPQRVKSNIDDFNMKNVIKELENLYLNSN